MWHGMSSTAAERVEMAKLLSATDAAGAPLRAKLLAEFEKRGLTTKGGMVPHFLRMMNADEKPADIGGWLDEKTRAIAAREKEEAEAAAATAESSYASHCRKLGVPASSASTTT